MAEGEVYRQGWTPDEISWSAFDPSVVESWLLVAVKAAALVEYNAPDYVTYLKRVFHDAGPELHAYIEDWGREESQHGKVLGRWAEMADPGFNLEEAIARFRKGYKPAHFGESDNTMSVRGSRRGEMIARCVVESGTSSYYSAIKDASKEPVLREIAGRIAADEFRHYKLFFETFQKQDEPDLPFWRKLLIAASRVTESDDDEISFAYYCATVRPDEEASKPYDRAYCSKRAFQISLRVYRRQHIQKLTRMVAKAIGADPNGSLARLAGALIWRMMRLRAGILTTAEAPV
ncbi:MAG: ferritin-like domain-containing protein [Alphaproteobacteria bacterium]|nr:ferritin-like domain-containing protein [Alphaproteobacteria bacterium]